MEIKGSLGEYVTTEIQPFIGIYSGIAGCLGVLSVIMVHNHPSGDPTPSHADIEMTKRIIEAASKLSISVHDHIIVGRNGHASFKGLGLI